MAQVELTRFSFNKPLNDHLKSAFGAKFDSAKKIWTVNGQKKATEANALIAEVVKFEHVKTAGTDAAWNQVNAEFPGIVAIHPLTGEAWHFISFRHFARGDRTVEAAVIAAAQHAGIEC